MLHVGLDITSLIYARGVSRYTANLTRSLLEENQVKLSLFGYSLRQHTQLKRQARVLSRNHSNITQTVIKHWPPSVMSKMWQWGINPVSKQLPGIQVFHSWDWLQPPDKDLALVSTIHDLAILKYPETAHPEILKMHKRAWKILKERQSEIIAVSRATKKDIVEMLEIPSHKVHVTYQALTKELFELSRSMSEEKQILIKDRLHLGSKPYFLFVGTREPRKNLDRVIKAWKPLAKQVELIIAGAAGWDSTSQNSIHPPAGLRFLGQVSDQELVVLYSEATAFVYPSLYEGFGLPILESFHFGTPVITSNTSSMVEVAGNAAVLVQPESSESIQEGMETVLNESLADQKKRLQQMIIRLQMFNWQTTARETVKVYQEAYSNRV